jgi:hypothetical protein
MALLVKLKGNAKKRRREKRTRRIVVVRVAIPLGLHPPLTLQRYARERNEQQVQIWRRRRQRVLVPVRSLWKPLVALM